ncbi:hypothetical protein SOCE26_044880 [Sorangium cellulosum]|uniref:DUF72 domain-containing protein n=1 Tax=Sorangium cellulosum TaxID=56 RepID=A0A2L0EUR5_SORCE|nr:DUF72 domain-containing protein [Sorangium cellulosum]AUX43048.1 hypothetical protein SOCE26_044880 [Sorangium cellulosum]
MSRSPGRRGASPAQLSLFGEAPGPAAGPAPSSPAAGAAGAADVMAAVYEDAARVAARLPGGVHLGTSSWSFPGWQGLVYARRQSTEELARDGLAEYARHPLLTTVGIDRSFYAPIPDSDFLRYRAQLPDGFRCICKALHAVVSQVLHHSQSPSDEGEGHAAARGRPEPNPDFLSVPLFLSRVAAPLLSVFRAHAGPVLIELSPVGPAHRLPPREFFDRLDAFLGALPRELAYAVELRERAYLTGEYREILGARGVAHTYSYWRNMPLPGAQADVVPVSNAPFALVRLLLKPGRRYEAEQRRFHPFDKVVEPDPAMREDVARIVCEAAALGVESFVLVNNKAEGSAPLTVRAIAEQVAEAWQGRAAGARG